MPEEKKFLEQYENFKDEGLQEISLSSIEYVTTYKNWNLLSKWTKDILDAKLKKLG